jgi:hypothetical protein
MLGQARTAPPNVRAAFCLEDHLKEATMKKLFLLFLLLAFTPAVLAQDRICRMGACVRTNSDGSVTVTLASGKTFKLTPQPALPATCEDGQLFFKATTGLHECVSGAWQQMRGAASGVTSFNTRSGAVSLSSVDVTDALGFTPESAANKDTNAALAANSDTKYPSQKAVKSYVDAGLSTKAASAHTHAGSDITSGTVADARLSSSVTLLGNTTTGTGSIVRDTSPSLTTPNIGAAQATSINGFTPGGVLHVTGSGSGVGNSGTSETDLATYSLPGGTLSANGKALRITAFGSFASNANLKTVKVYFGSTVIFQPASSNGSTGNWAAFGYVIRTGATSQVTWGRAAQTSGGNESANTNPITTPAETLSGAVTIKVTGQSSAASNDVLLKGFVIEILN